MDLVSPKDCSAKSGSHSSKLIARPIGDILAKLDPTPASESACDWPRLDQLGLGQPEKQWRQSGIGGSDANIILSGDLERVLKLWREKRGEQEPEDLSGHLPVMLGCWTEPFNRMWFEMVMGQSIIDVGDALVSSQHPWRRCTLDGRVELSGAVWEAKHCNAFAKVDDLLERYMPQLQHNMAVAGADTAMLSIIIGNHKYEIIEVASDWLYQLELLAAEEEFWDAVCTGREPVPASPPPSPRPVGTREVCLEGNNSWASAAANWLGYKDAAKVHASACKVIKELVEDDVTRAFGHGIEAKRSKAGALSIRELAL